VTINTRNPLNTASDLSSIYILSGIAGLSINDGDTLVPLNVPKTFFATYEYFSTVSCLYIKYSDMSIVCYGQSSVCLNLPSDLLSKISSCPSPIQPFTFVNSTVSFTRAFNTSEAWIDAYAWNQVTRISAQAFFRFPLSTANCGLPRIEFDIAGPLIGRAHTVQRSQAFSIAARVILDCSQSLNNSKQWKISHCDVTTEKCESTSFLTQLVAGLPSARSSEIWIVSRALPVGTYLFNFSVVMNGVNGFTTFDFIYVKIISSAIKVNMLINGTSMISRGVTQSVVFQPGVYSIDPDSTYFNPLVNH
jgi:hypothetical protein